MPSLSGKTVLILGSDGFVGRNLARYCDERGWRHHDVGRAAGDLARWENVEAAFRAAPPADRIVHLVTRQRTGAVQYGIQGEMLQINSRIHLNVLEAWRLFQPQAKLITTGSSCAYPESDSLLAEEAYQTGPLHPSVLGYGLAKQVLAVGSAAHGRQYGLSWLHCIFATLYGPHDHKAPDRSHFVGGMLDRAVRERASGGAAFSVWGSPGVVREVLHVDDQIEAMLAADAAFSDTLLNCAANAPVTVDGVARAVLAALDWPAEPAYDPATFQGSRFKLLDSGRFLKATGWAPRIGLEEGLRGILRSDYGL